MKAEEATIFLTILRAVYKLGRQGTVLCLLFVNEKKSRTGLIRLQYFAKKKR